MTRRQIKKAARLYALAVVAHMDLTGDHHQEVRDEAISQAHNELERLGYDYRELTDEAACVYAVLNKES